MVYADYDYYCNEYFGSAIQDHDFPRFALRGSQYIDYITRGKAEARANLEAVKMCCCELAEQYKVIETAKELARKSLAAGAAGGAELQSETVAAWSRSYRPGGDSALSAEQAAKEAEEKLLVIARKHLAKTGLLYRGGCCC